ncbi:SprT-like domain-containing protein [Microbulbifer epialgicus]|uniref:SprT-like domain-containing protein n=1 Tax=Microbulbifer epialgicus TaxID=393907 RepID=A0ABV4P785_9GAMM
MNPTTELYQALEKAYEHFNLELFDNNLPDVIFTFQRKSGVMGYFSPERWGNAVGDTRNEIAINPSFLASSRLIEICQTLVHEMAHCWQYQLGKPSRKGYHNLQWAKKMMAIGLMPSSTGEPGGELVGQTMGDYIIEGGRFIQSFESLTETINFNFPWFDRKALPRLYEPVVASIQSPKDSDVPSFSGLNFEQADYQDLIRTVAQSGIVSLTEYYNDQEGRETLSSLVPDTFVLQEAAKKSTRTKYVCDGCGVILYGKANLNISCDDCQRSFFPADR